MRVRPWPSGALWATGEVNEAFRQEAASARYEGMLGVSEDPLVSADIVGDPRAAVIDLELTRVVDGTLVKVMVPESAPRRSGHAATEASASTWRGASVSRAMTRRWICEVPS
jgi:hypothetical protein